MFPHFWFLFLGGDFGVGYFRLLFVCLFFLLCAHPSYRRQLTVFREKLCTYNQVTRITYARPVRQEEKIHLNAIADMHSLGCGEKETPPIHIYMYTYPAAVR